MAISKAGEVGNNRGNPIPHSYTLVYFKPIIIRVGRVVQGLVVRWNTSKKDEWLSVFPWYVVAHIPLDWTLVTRIYF